MGAARVLRIECTEKARETKVLKQDSKIGNLKIGKSEDRQSVDFAFAWKNMNTQ
jgi:hypothetical protein